MIQKIQTLQRRLIAKTEEVVERDMMLSEKEKMYAELKAMLARQPGPEVAEALSHYQQMLAERTKQLKALASEMQMYQTQVGDYKYEIDKLTRQLVEAKKSFYELKNKERQGPSARLSTTNSIADAGETGSTGRDFAIRAAESQRSAAVAAVPRFVGGGFNVNAA
jgi:chromosome segregation ATPase